MDKIVRVIIPAFNEENAVGKVIDEIPKAIVTEIIVVNNNSNDETKTVAKKHGATVLDEPQQGYGRACLKGIDYVKSLKNQRFYYVSGTCSHCILASFPSLDHQKHGPGNCLPFWCPKSKKNNKKVPKWVPGDSQNGL